MINNEIFRYFEEKKFLETLSIPVHKPDLLKILDFIIIPKVIDFKLLTTPEGLSYEGDYLSGCKLIVNLNLTEKLSYVCNTYDQNIHVVHYTHLTSCAITLPKTINDTPIHDLIMNGNLSIKPSTLSCYTKAHDYRLFQVSALLLVHVSVS